MQVDRITNPQARPGSTKLAFHASRIIIDAGVLISMAAMSMPFVTAAGVDKNSVAADAFPVLILLAPIFLVTLIPDHARPIPAPLAWFSLLLGIAAFPYAVVKYLDAAGLAKTLDGDVGFGARLLIFGTFVTLAGIGISLARNILNIESGGASPAGRGASQRPRPVDKTPGAQPRRRGPTAPRTAAASTPSERAVDPQQVARRPVANESGSPVPAAHPRPQHPADPGRGPGPTER